MRVPGFDRALPLWLLAFALLIPAGAGAQLRTVISNEIAVSGSEATLRLDFQDRGELAIALREGEVLVDGESVGSYTRGDPLDRAWRALLGSVVSLDDGPLATALFDWTPPEELGGEAQDLAGLLDRTLESALTLPEHAADPAAPSPPQAALDEGRLLSALLRSATALRGLSEALEGVDLGHTLIRVDEDLVVGESEVVEGTVILVDGDLELRGIIEGDVVVADGTVRLEEGGRITGDLRVAGGSVERDGGQVEGSIELIQAEEAREAVGVEDLESLRRDLAKEIRREMDRERSSGPSFIMGPLRHVGAAIAGLLENLAVFLVLAVLGVLAVHFGRDRLEVVALTARRAPARSALVGLAGGFLLIPVWILGIVALVITIVGIPVLLAWIPLFPIAAGLAGLFGYLAVARNVGEWVAEQEYRGLEWIRGSNSFYAVIAGVGAFLVPCVAANVARLLGIGFLHGLLAFVGSSVSFLAAAIGFGAVLLTRGGRIRPYETYHEFEEDYWGEGPPVETPEERADAPASAGPEEPDDEQPRKGENDV